MTLNDYKQLIETRLDLPTNALLGGSEKILPNTNMLTKEFIKKTHLDDLFQFHNGKLVFTNRMMTFVGEITDRQVLTGHYYFELRKKDN